MTNPRDVRARWPFLLFWALLASFLVVRAIDRPEKRGVILAHLEFGQRLLHGQDLYAPTADEPDHPLHPPYPPSFGLLAAPFVAIDETLGRPAVRGAWALLEVASLAAMALAWRALLSSWTPQRSDRQWHWLWLGGFLLVARFLVRDTHGGGGNLVNVALCLGAAATMQRGRERLAGICLGLSLATKPTQLWFLPVLLVLGRRRTVAWTIVAGLLAVAATLPLLRFDPAPWSRWIEGSWRLGTQTDAFADPALGFPPFEWMNQSLRCAIARWCGTVPAPFAARVAWGLPPGLGLSTPTVAWLGRLASFALLTSLLTVTWKTRRAPQALPAVAAAALAVSTLLSPLSWKAHYVALFPALCLVLLRATAPGPWRNAARGLLAVYAVCCLLGRDLIGDAADEWLNSCYFVTGFGVVLFALALGEAVSAAREHHEAAGGAAAGEGLG